MKLAMNRKILAVAIATLALSAVGATQLKALIKLVGVGAAVKQFGPQINSAINKVAKHTDTNLMTTKVVPIVSAGIASRQAVGAVQVTGPRNKVEQVQAVAEINQDILGREVNIRVLIPVSSRDVIKDIKRVEGVGVSGIVDLKL